MRACPSCGRAVETLSRQGGCVTAHPCGCDLTDTLVKALGRDRNGGRSLDHDRLRTDGGLIQPSPRADLSAFQRDVLVTVGQIEEQNDLPPHGLGIKEHLEADYGEKINHGRLYPNLDELVEEGLLEKGELDRRTNSYNLTDEGRSVLRKIAANYNEVLDA
jgi:DNA-binding MarR family transcriptional regulator